MKTLKTTFGLILLSLSFLPYGTTVVNAVDRIAQQEFISQKAQSTDTYYNEELSPNENEGRR